MEATMTLLPGDPPYRRPETIPGVRQVWETGIATARAAAVQATKPAPAPVKRESSCAYVVRSERVVRRDGNLWFHWWSDGRLSFSIDSSTQYVQVYLGHVEALALVDFMNGVQIADRDELLLQRVREAGVEAVGL